MNKPNCFSHSKCNCCTKQAECTYYQYNKHLISQNKNLFEIQVSNPGRDLFN